jgi:hypothetical protein
MIDPSTETTISLTEAGRRCPPGRNGARPALSTVLRWILSGCRGPCGETIKLRAGRCGGKWFTSEEALREFIERLTPHMDDEAAPASRTPRQRKLAAESARREMESLGA